MKAMDGDVAAYFSRFDGITLERLHQVRALILELLPEAGEAIKYGIPTVLFHGNLVHYAAFKNHTGLYPTPSGIDAFKQELRPFRQGKGSIQFPHAEALPAALIKKIVLFRIEEAEERAERM
ncbi:DUF1801 domain-containing protein [bacterium]|nr:DUF1801 domain-containing protein [bacterium]